MRCTPGVPGASVADLRQEGRLGGPQVDLTPDPLDPRNGRTGPLCSPGAHMGDALERSDGREGGIGRALLAPNVTTPSVEPSAFWERSEPLLHPSSGGAQAERTIPRHVIAYRRPCMVRHVELRSCDRQNIDHLSSSRARDAEGQRLDLVVVGHVMQEWIEREGVMAGPLLGGPAAYASLAASKAGGHVGLLTIVGRGDATEVLEGLEASPVDLRGIVRRGHHTRTTLLKYESDGTKSVKYVHVPPPITPTDVPAEFLSTDCVLLCPMDFEIVPATAQLLRAHARFLGADLGGFGGAVSTRHPHTDAGVASQLCALLPELDAVKASDEDCRHLDPSLDNPEACVDALKALGARTVFLTIGARGSLVWDRGKLTHIPAFRATVVDPTGAGDVYCGTLMLELHRGRASEDAALYASAAASLFIQQSGGASFERNATDLAIRTRMNINDPQASRALKAGDEDRSPWNDGGNSVCNG